MKVKVIVPGAAELIRKKGLGKDGAVQMFHTQNVRNRIIKYMPYRAGVLSSKLTRIKSETEIEVAGPYAHYQYIGEVWGPNIPIVQNGVIVGWRSPPIKYPTGRKIQYNTGPHGNPLAGPFWDKRLMAAEGNVMCEDLQRFVDRRAGNV